MEKFITASVSPNKAATATSRQARRLARSVTALRSGLAPTTAITAADVHSRRPVTAAGGIWVNSLAASPAPNWTEKIPVTTSADGGTAVHGARRAARAGGSSPGPAAAPCSSALGCGNRHFPVSTSGLLPAEQARRQRDADRGPDDQHGEVAHRQPCPVLQDAMQPVGQRPRGQQREHGPR